MDDLLHIQHLLRHLNNLAGLRKNPLVAHLFARKDLPDYEAHRQVRNLVLKAVDTLADEHSANSSADALRWQSIVRRCDLQGDPHKTVCAELGLGRRQFYRVRRTMHEALLKALVPEFSAPKATTAHIPLQAEITIDLARGLSDNGRTTKAAALLRDVARSAPQTSDRLRAIAELARLYLQMRQPDRIAPLVDAARRLTYGSASSSDPVDIAQTHLAEATLALARENFEGYGTQLRRARDFTLPLPNSHRALDIHFKATIELARLQMILGKDVARASDEVASIAHRINARPGFGRRRVEALCARGELALVLGNTRAAIQLLAQTVCAAHERNIPKQTIVASVDLALLYTLAGDSNLAHQHLRTATLASRAASGPKDAADTLVNIAFIYLAEGQAREALRTLDRLKRMHGESPAPHITDEIAAVALARLGNANDAIATIDRAVAQAHALRVHRYTGRAEAHRAEIYHRAGHHDEARRGLHCAIELVESHGSAATLAYAYELSGAIARNEKHRAYAADLKAEGAAALH